MHKAMMVVMTCLFASVAGAHSPLKSTSPSDGAVLAIIPSEITFEFQGTIRLTRVTVMQADQSGFDLDLSAHTIFVSEYLLALPRLESGYYTVDWRGLGADGHPMAGSFGFTVE